MASNTKPVSTPLSDVRVVNIGTGWAGRVAAMLIADQGADVVEFVRPGRAVHPCDPLLDRGKRLLEIDLNDAAARQMARELVAGSDVVFENMHAGAAARLQLDYPSLDNHERIIYVSLPGFAEGDNNHTMPAWEGIIDAAVGIYTDLSPLGPLIGGEPVYTAIPMASAYGGVLGAVAASMGLYRRQRSGKGQRIVVPLADAVLSAMALLIAKIDGQPERYNFPSIDNTMMHTLFPILRELREHLTEDHMARIVGLLKSRAMPGLNFYECADRRILFVVAMDHVYQTRAFLETVGVYDRAIAEGMIAGNPYSESREGNNLNNAGDLMPHNRQRLLQMISDSIKTRPGKEWETKLRNANVPVTVVQTDSEWLADAQLLEAGVITDIEDPILDKVRMPGRFVSIEGAATQSPKPRPRQRVKGAAWQQAPLPPICADDAVNCGLLEGVRVLDLSNIIAGPAAGRTLAEHGADVLRIDSPAPQAGPRITMWFGVDVNQGKRAMVLDLKTGAGRGVLARLVKESDVVLHNFLDKSARSLGIAHDQLTAINPDIISCQISAWGGSEGGPFKDDPAFDPVLQAATGIMARYGQPDKPVLHAIASCVDYITGFSAALGIAQALFAREQGCGGSYVRTSLAMGAQLVQFPFMTHHAKSEQLIPSGQSARGDGCEQHLYQTADGWAFVGCRAGDGAKLAAAVSAESATAKAVADKLRDLPLAALREKLAALPGAAAIAVQTLAQLRDKYTVDTALSGSDHVPSNSFRLRLGPHPSGYPTTIPLATWIRPELSTLTPLQAAPSPGQHSVSVLRDAGYAEEEVAALVDNGVVHTRWKLLRHYLPL
jgi:crotonobetainyl-CoA:carnitine CoA-transferase CaiB-like acyl-CoA transferase